MDFARQAAEDIWERLRGSNAIAVGRWQQRHLEIAQRHGATADDMAVKVVTPENSPTARAIDAHMDSRPPDPYPFCEGLMLELLTGIIRTGRVDLLPTDILTATKGINVNTVARQEEARLDTEWDPDA